MRPSKASSLRSGASLLGLLLVGCLAVPREVPRATVAWQLEPDGDAGVLSWWRDGRIDLTLQDRRGDAPQHAAARSWAASDARAAILREVDPLVLSLPRWSHVSAESKGVRLQFSIDATLCHESFDSCPPALQDWLRRVFAGEPELASILAPVLQPMRAPTFSYGPGAAPSSLLPALDLAQPDLALRHLAARIVIEERPVVLRPELTAAYRQSCASGSRGDYYLASALIAVGVLDGLARVVEIAHSSHPQWANEASADLANWFRTRELGCPDPVTDSDAFLVFVQQRRSRLEVDTRRRTYRLRDF